MVHMMSRTFKKYIKKHIVKILYASAFACAFLVPLHVAHADTPTINIITPTSGMTLVSGDWVTNIDWGGALYCKYSYDGITYQDSSGCSPLIPQQPQNQGPNTLYIKASNDDIDYVQQSVNFTYNPPVVAINSPVDSTTYTPGTWAPNIDWGGASYCEYSYDLFFSSGSIDCASGTIPPPNTAGDWTLSVRASYDGTVYSSTRNTSFHYSIPPVVTISSPAENGSYYSTTWSTSVDWGGAINCQYSYDNVTYTNLSSCNGDNPHTPPDNGPWTLYLRASFADGVWSQTNVNFTYSTGQPPPTSPTIAIYTPTSGNTYYSDVWYPTVDWGGASYCQYSYDGTSYTPISCDNNIPPPQITGNSTLYLKASFDDVDYGFANMSFDYQVYVPPPIPNISINSPITNYGTSYNPSSWAPDINWDGASYCEYSLDGGTTYTSISCDNSIPAPTLAGHYYLVILASYNGYDNNSATTDFDFVIPVPNISINSPTEGSTLYSNTWAPSVNWYDANYCEYSYNNIDFTAVNCSLAGSDISSPSLDGSYTLLIRSSYDNVNFSGTSADFTYNNYPGSPTVTINNPVSGAVYNLINWAPDINWGGSTYCRYSYDGELFLDTSCDNKLPSPGTGAADGGTYSLQLQGSYDGINYSATTSSGNFDYHTTPNISISAPLNGTTVNSDAWVVDINWDGAIACQYSYNGGETYSDTPCDDSIPPPPNTTRGYFLTLLGSYVDTTTNYAIQSSEFSYAVVPTVTINNPTPGGSISAWAPDVNWDGAQRCRYSYDGINYTNMGCDNSIPGPSVGSNDLYLQGSYDEAYYSTPAHVSFTYTQPPVPAISVYSPASDAQYYANTWAPNIGWDGASYCEYSFDGAYFIPMSACDNNIPPPGADGSYGLYTQASYDGTNYSGIYTIFSFSIANDPSTIPPNVSVQSPYNGSILSGTTTLAVNTAVGASTSSIPATISGVQFYVDGTAEGVSGTTTPYSITWNTHLVLDGTHTIQAVAIDSFGNQGSLTPITVTVDNTKPSISSISSGTLGTSIVHISWITNEEADGQIYYGTTTSYGLQTSLNSVASTTHSFDISDLTPNTLYHYQVRSADPLSNLATSSDQTFTTSALPAPTVPIITLVSPASGLLVSGTTTLSVIATTTSGSGTVAGVRFVLDETTLLGSEVTSAPYTLALDTTQILDGTHTISAVVRTSDSYFATSTITIDTDNLPPQFSTTVDGISETLATIHISPTELVSGYIVYSVGSTTATSTFATSSTPVVALTGLSPSTTYTYIVRAVDKVGHVTTSSPISFTTSATPVVVVTPSTGNTGGGSTGGGSVSGSGAASIVVVPVSTPNQNVGQSTTQTGSGTGGSVVFTQTTQVGSRIVEVTKLQKFLNAQGFTVQQTGYFGGVTKASLAKFQKAHGIKPAVGIFGPITRAYVNNMIQTHPELKDIFTNLNVESSAPEFKKVLRYGMTDSDVKKLQVFLNTHGYLIAQKGSGSLGNESTYFGLGTQKTLSKFQSDHSIKPATGVFTLETISLVNSLMKNK